MPTTSQPTRTPFAPGTRVFVWGGRITQMYVSVDLGASIEVHAYGKLATTSRNPAHVFASREDAEAYVAHIMGR